METRQSILIVDDEQDNRDLLAQILGEKYRLLMAEDGEEGLRIARTQLPDLILLDITMPKLDGIAVCESLRSHEGTREIPVIMLTAVSDIECRIKSFTLGADDFVPKPFRPKELLARVESKMRRVSERKGKSEVLECGNLVVDLRKLEASINGKSLHLSVLEFNLLKCLVQNKDRVMSRERILEAVWRDAAVSDRTVDTHIVSLRKKIEGFDHTLATIYGAGYVLKKE